MVLTVTVWLKRYLTNCSYCYDLFYQLETFDGKHDKGSNTLGNWVLLLLLLLLLLLVVKLLDAGCKVAGCSA